MLMTQEFQAALLESINSNIASLRSLSDTLESLLTEISGVDDQDKRKDLLAKADELSKSRDELVAQTNKLVDQYVAIVSTPPKEN